MWRYVRHAQIWLQFNSVMKHCGLLIASGQNPQILIINYRQMVGDIQEQMDKFWLGSCKYGMC